LFNDFFSETPGRHAVRRLCKDEIMHYPRRVSRIKRKRAIGFRARMRTKNGRKMINRKRRLGRSLNVADK
jgi:large subunit ribosomal protein L34